MQLGKRALAALAAATVGGLLLTGCAGGGTSGGNTGGAAATGGTLTLASPFDNNSFDPAALEIGNRVHYWMPVYDTLLILDKDAQPQPNMATSWSYNADNTVLNLKLRDGIKFTDGTPFDGAAVKANLEHLKNGKGQNAYMAASIANVEVVSPTEVNLRLTAADPGLIYYLGVVGGAMASPTAEASPNIASTPVGSGPYKLDKGATTSGSQYTYTRNPDYWNKKDFPYDKIVVKPIADVTARLNALKSGQVDAGLIEAKSVKEAEASRLKVSTDPIDWQGLFIADRAGKTVPALGDVRVRRAINMAIDADSILKNLQLGQGEVTDQIFNKKSQAYVSGLDNKYSFDVDAAKKLMSEAGYADGFEVLMPDLAGFPQITPIIEQQLGALNIKVKWQKVPADATISEVLSGKFPMFFFSLGSQSAWQDIQKVALPTSPWNTAKVNNPELNALVQAAQKASPGADQDKAMQKVNTWLVDNAWFAPWYRVSTIIATSAKTQVTPQPWNVAPWIRNYRPAS
ncbi:ABC transporter substrate-binding protein [Arthrobacter bambusae]|uniref:ABC transporter substrate-binding protein n=1 Tax=Arthrobacter bambusae TaxID=1338426 RepID=UPI002780AE86|nr:ABC transporter substrate-binding protein [Arthrobacter bambusae]MDQ0242143.1 peptide/nickel transport system substrate-binding protein [Arthrobacter bambusae]